MFITVDRYVLSVAEYLARFVQRNFGIKPIQIALAGFVLFACTFISWWFIPGVTISATNKVFDVLLFISIFLVTTNIYPILEKEIEEDASKGLSNKHKIRPLERSMRVMALIIFVLHLSALLSDGSLMSLNGSLQGLGLLVNFYFIACDPLPPGPSRLRKLLESITSRTSVARN